MSAPRDRATAFAPASVANVGVGFDILGFSANFAGDRVTVERIKAPEVQISKVSGLVTTIPSDARRNTATAGLVRLIEDKQLRFGFRLQIEKGIPLGSGMGGSAASAVAAIFAANVLLESPLPPAELLSYALLGEAQASGAFHADNLAPCLIGGLTLSRVTETSSLPQVEVTSIPLPEGVHTVLVHPHLQVKTKEARGLLKKEISLKDHIQQAAHLAGFITGCFRSDLSLIKNSLRDLIIEPQRAHLIPGFASVQKAALDLGALGCTISGAGPSVFAWAEGESRATEIREAMLRAFGRAGVAADGWSGPLNSSGARIEA